MDTRSIATVALIGVAVLPISTSSAGSGSGSPCTEELHSLSMASHVILGLLLVMSEALVFAPLVAWAWWRWRSPGGCLQLRKRRDRRR